MQEQDQDRHFDVDQNQKAKAKNTDALQRKFDHKKIDHLTEQT